MPLSEEVYTAEEVRQMLDHACAAAGSQTNWAAQAGVTRSYVSHVLHSDLPPGPAIVAKLGLEQRLLYVRVPRRGKRAT